MASVYPPIFPSEKTQDPGMRAEKKVFDSLLALSDDWTVFHSLEWVGPTDDLNTSKVGEADFVVIHKKLGTLVLEVKGGTVKFDPESRKWTSTSLSGRVNKIKDPFAQVLKTCYWMTGVLRKRIRGSASFRAFSAVCFPDSSLRNCELPAHGPRETVLDLFDLDNMEAALLRALEFHLNGSACAPPAPAVVADALIRLHSTAMTSQRGMVEAIAEKDRIIDRLTKEQAKVLPFVEANKRLFVTGCAGSGKTYVALALAESYASSGMTVRIVCFNELLARELQARTMGLPGVTANTFHGTCEAMARQAGIELSALDQSNYYDRLPEVGLSALELNKDLCDAVIVDEAQDFSDEWWIVVESMLQPEGRLAVFADANQHLYKNREDSWMSQLKSFPQVDLRQNVRNTQEIHRVSMRYYEDDSKPVALGPQGEDPRLIASGIDDLPETLEEAINTLTKDQRIPVSEIIVLTPNGASRTRLSDIKRVGNFEFSDVSDQDGTKLSWSTIRKYKGMESTVVILVEFDDVLDSANLRELTYVGSSRARDYLVVIGTDEALQVFGVNQ